MGGEKLTLKVFSQDQNFPFGVSKSLLVLINEKLNEDCLEFSTPE